MRGPGARNKGMALFPRPVGGRHLALCRSDGETIGLTTLDDDNRWQTPVPLHAPAPRLGADPGRQLRITHRDRRRLAGPHPRRRARCAGTPSARCCSTCDHPERVIAELPGPLLAPDDDRTRRLRAQRRLLLRRPDPRRDPLAAVRRQRRPGRRSPPSTVAALLGALEPAPQGRSGSSRSSWSSSRSSTRRPSSGRLAGVPPAQQLLPLGVDRRAPDAQRGLVPRRHRQVGRVGLVGAGRAGPGSGPAGRAAARASSRSRAASMSSCSCGLAARRARSSAASTEADRASLRRRAWSASFARSPSARTSGAKVRPWPTSVTSTTTNAQNSSRSRSGNGAPLSVTSGRVKIAARLITPRVPDQLRATTSRPVSRSLAVPRRRGAVVSSMSDLRRPAGCAATGAATGSAAATAAAAAARRRP